MTNDRKYQINLSVSVHIFRYYWHLQGQRLMLE